MSAPPAPSHRRKPPPPSKRLLPADRLLATEPTVAPFVGAMVPERHAARIVAEMARWLVHMRAYLDNEIIRAIRTGRSHYGSPKAQQRLAARLRKAGKGGFLEVMVKTGKRGRFALQLVEWNVYNPATQKTIVSDDDTIPAEPWLELTIIVINFPNEPRGVRLFVVSHHAMVRLVQRCGAREPLDLIRALTELYARVVDGVVLKDEDLDAHPVRYFDVAGGVAVLKYDDAHRSMVVTTVLDRDMRLPEQDDAGAAP